MLKLAKVAITGALCSGKSLVCDFLKHQGAYIVSADNIVHKLLSTDRECIKQIANLLGNDVVLRNQINREKVAQKVFSHPELLNALEKIIHPKVLTEILNEYEKVKKSEKYQLFVAEVPLLYEANWEKHFDKIILVMSDLTLCKSRFIQTKGTKEEFELRMKRRIDLVPKKKTADFIIENNGTKDELHEKVLNILSYLS